MRTRVIRRSGAGEPWVAPMLGDGQRAPATLPGEFTDPAEAALTQAREEGLARGYEEGLQAAREQNAALLSVLEQAVAQVQMPLAQLDEQVETALCQMALAIARQVVRREIELDPGQVLGVVREARAALSEVQGTLNIAVNPREAQRVRELFGEGEAAGGVQVEEDPGISSGGCVLRTQVSLVDATIEARIGQVAAQLLGDSRAQEAGG